MQRPSVPDRRHIWQRVTLAQMRRIKDWHAAHPGVCPVEKQVWEGVLTFWLMGWTGWLPAIASESKGGFGLCLLGVLAPRIYVAWRTRAHEAKRMRCDWLDPVDPVGPASST